MINKKDISIDRLIYEIDRFINVLNNKKKELIRASGKDYKAVRDTINDSEKNKFRSFTLSLSTRDYNKLQEAADIDKETINKFIKKKYFDYFINDIQAYKEWEQKNGKPVYKPDPNNCRTIALALNAKDTYRFESAAKDVDSSTRSLMKYFINQFLVEYETKNIRPDFNFDTFKGLKFVKCDSSAFTAYAYKEDEKILYVRFYTGSVYSYLNVPKEIYQELVNAKSKGSYFNNNIINLYNYKKIC